MVSGKRRDSFVPVEFPQRSLHGQKKIVGEVCFRLSGSREFRFFVSKIVAALRNWLDQFHYLSNWGIATASGLPKYVTLAEIEVRTRMLAPNFTRYLLLNSARNLRDPTFTRNSFILENNLWKISLTSNTYHIGSLTVQRPKDFHHFRNFCLIKKLCDRSS